MSQPTSLTTEFDRLMAAIDTLLELASAALLPTATDEQRKQAYDALQEFLGKLESSESVEE